MRDLKLLLKEGAKALSIDIGEDQVRAFLLYLKELKRWGQRINLTSVKDDREIVIRHFLDALTPLEFLKEGWKILDMGSGAGFPGIPLKIVLPTLSVTLVDSSRKKVAFERHIIRRLGLKGIEALHIRGEDLPSLEGMMEGFDAVLSRAFSHLREFLLLSLPLLKVGGLIIAMKGRKGARELRGLDLEGVELVDTREKHLPFSCRRTILFVFRKCFT